MKLFVNGISYRTAPVGLREQLAVSQQRLACTGCRLKIGSGLSEVVVLSTCNRVEIYGVAETANPRLDSLFEVLGKDLPDYRASVYSHHGDAAVRHLFSVASGLDSMVLGETEITGQVKQAYDVARDAKLAGRVLNRLFQTAQQTAKEIRTQTQIGRGATSVGSVAVELAQRIFDEDLASKTVLIIGAGKMGEACTRHLAKKGAGSVLVANRSYERAVALAAEFNGRAVRFEDLFYAVAQADIVVSSTGAPQTILHRADLEPVMARRRNRPLFLIDIAVPRDIDADVESVDGVYLYNVDHLEAIVRENVKHREQELAQCLSIVEERAAAAMARVCAVAPVKARTVREPALNLATSGIPEMA